jgi:hypothetical protein
MELAVRWVVGLFLVALVGGHFVAGMFLRRLRTGMGLGHFQAAERVPRWLTGSVERLFFTFLIAFQISGAGTAMVGGSRSRLPLIGAAHRPRGRAWKIESAMHSQRCLQACCRCFSLSLAASLQAARFGPNHRCPAGSGEGFTLP